MKSFEELIKEKRSDIQSMHAPEEMENRLRTALNNLPKQKRYRGMLWKIAAVTLVLAALAGYHVNGLAYYGKKLLGFDEMMPRSLKELNEQGMGQPIEETKILDDGSELMIDGIISDPNRMIMFYHLRNEKGLPEDAFGKIRFVKLTGFLTDSYAYGGTGQLSDDGKEFKAYMEFGPVSAFAKTLTLHYKETKDDGSIAEKTATLPYDPNKAMQTEYKQNINKTVKLDKGTVTFETISATPTMTLIEGKVNVENLDQLPVNMDGIQLIANGKPVELFGSGVNSSLVKKNFELRFDALPNELESLELVMEEFVGYQELDQQIQLESVSPEQVLGLSDYELIINQVKVLERKVEITITTDEDLLLDGEGIHISTRSEKIPLETTVNQEYEKGKEGNIKFKRTLVFETNEKPESLYIKGIYYRKSYNASIEIPVK